jgi:hypothetical protein
MIKVMGKVTGLVETQSALSTLPSLFVQAGLGAMTESLEMISEILRKEHMEGPYPEEIQSRTGSFRKTFRRGQPNNIFQVTAQGSTITGTFGSTDKRARILNDGGVIYPRRGPFLAVRSDFTKTAGGVVQAKYQQPLRQIPNTFVRPIKRRRGLAELAVWEKIGKKTIIPIAWLVRQTYHVGRKFMEKTSAKAGPMIPPIFERRFQMVIDRMNQTLAKIRGL